MFSSQITISGMIDVEKKLQNIFPGQYPVVLSSGRVALKFALEHIGVNRLNTIAVFPNASHCVLDSICRVTTPQPFTDNFSGVGIYYHQWGYFQNEKNKMQIIEDSVDSLYAPGAKLFSMGGNYEVWSFPKILATVSGGVLWCRSLKDAIEIRKKRDARGGSLFIFLMRILSKYFNIFYYPWHGLELEFGKISNFEKKEILAAISSWEDIVEDRKKKYSIISPFSILPNHVDLDRLPSNVPVELALTESELKDLGISSGYRYFYFIGSGKQYMKKVLPIPIHQDVSLDWLKRVASVLSQKSAMHKN